MIANAAACSAVWSQLLRKRRHYNLVAWHSPDAFRCLRGSSGENRSGMPDGGLNMNRHHGAGGGGSFPGGGGGGGWGGWVGWVGGGGGGGFFFGGGGGGFRLFSGGPLFLFGGGGGGSFSFGGGGGGFFLSLPGGSFSLGGGRGGFFFSLLWWRRCRGGPGRATKAGEDFVSAPTGRYRLVVERFRYDTGSPSRIQRKSSVYSFHCFGHMAA